jgi:hypothetical protein
MELELIATAFTPLAAYSVVSCTMASGGEMRAW